MSLVTQCPKCASEYEVTADQLKLHDGLVRCGHCSHVFDGLACLKDSLPTLTRKATQPGSAVNSNANQSPDAHAARAPVLEVPAPAPVPATTEQEQGGSTPPKTPITPAPTAPPPEARPAAEPVSESQLTWPAPPDDGPFIPSVDRRPQAASMTSGRLEPKFDGERSVAPLAAADEPSLGALLRSDGEQTSGVRPAEPTIKVMGETRVRGDDPSAAGRTMPEFLEDDEDEDTFGSRVYWMLGSIVLALALVVQSFVTFRNDIVSAVPALRPALVALCAPVGCDVSYVRQVERIFIVGSTLQQDPDAAIASDESAYNLGFTLQNRGAYPQPWPALMLTLTDASGTAVIKKALMPAEFLPADLLTMPFNAKQEVAVDIPLRVKELSISGFELDRFFP